MKNLSRVILVLPLIPALALAAEGGSDEGNLQVWTWINFVLLVIGLGYMMMKLLPPVFASRSSAIVQDMNESAKIRQEADARVADVERRLAGLEIEIANLREQSRKEADNETARLASHTADEIAKIQVQTEREIASASKAARTELKRYAAGLAVQLAEQKIRARMTSATEDEMVRGFVHDLK